MHKEDTTHSYYISKPEPYQSCMLALRDLILRTNPEICHERKFQIPFFTYKGKKLGYIWLNRKKLMLGFCTDRSLLTVPEGVKPKDQYESILIDPNADLPVALITKKLQYCIETINKG
ncbi:DUF1801 domain-containing protein [Mucilaginibacter celer]|uniref:DUF1801 domain-containing protein n=1 Tax=Mucilaginibacter celer TaxID=2305508 RepID=A0A494VU07_9SPHI|nr:DUF1801 domain-containing protein [Mucilaginibacter celer]AYL99076.1 DUF1801 domain-containing protein [Mucilaginibacter celer]